MHFDADSLRITISWADEAIWNQWLEVRMKANDNTHLVVDDVFYFGNAVGETGDVPGDTLVDRWDVAAVAANPRGPDDPTLITDPYDFNRDGLVDAADLALAETYATDPDTRLWLLDLREAGLLVLPGEDNAVGSPASAIGWIIDDQIAGTRIEMTIVHEPSAIGDNGEVSELPASTDWVHEWQSFWVEIWVSTPETTTVGVADDAYVLLARVKFASTDGDQVPVDAAGRNIGPYDMQMELADGHTELVDVGAVVPELGGSPDTELWAVIYDIDDNHQIDFGDSSFFAAAFGRTVDSSADPPHVWWADFDKSGRVDFGDLAFFAPNFGKTREGVQAGDQTLVFPTNFPDAWRNGAGGEGEGGGEGDGQLAGGEGEASSGNWMLAEFGGPHRSSLSPLEYGNGSDQSPGVYLQRQEPSMPDTPARVLDVGREYSLDQPLAGHARHRLADIRRDGSELEREDPLEDVLSLLADLSSGRRGNEASDRYDCCARVSDPAQFPTGGLLPE